MFLKTRYKNLLIISYHRNLGEIQALAKKAYSLLPPDIQETRYQPTKKETSRKTQTIIGTMDFSNPFISIGREAIYQFSTLSTPVGSLQLLSPTEGLDQVS